VIPAVARRLPDGRRLHLQHGPMDVIVEVTGRRDAVADAETAAIARFDRILGELVPQLPSLRSPVGEGHEPVGTIARRMTDAAMRFSGIFLTPMICVAGSVADELRSLIAEVAGVERAYVNNGGDISLHLTPGASLRVGLVPSLETGRHEATLEVDAGSAIRGLATSGWGGRSFSFGIADAVTVVATTSAVADVAASLVANAVDLPGHPAIERTRADELDPDSDLRDLLVTTAVGRLSDREVDQALDGGVAAAERYLAQVPDLLGAVIVLRGRRRAVGHAVAALQPSREAAHAR
jgi:ApbE superfamily uncharacterized protein (UPF0280 family)